MNRRILFALLLFAPATFAETTAPIAHLRPPSTALPVPYVLEFEHGATVDFADVTQQEPGPLRGYVYVRYQGELVLIPVYRPTPDGTIWRVQPKRE